MKFSYSSNIYSLTIFCVFSWRSSWWRKLHWSKHKMRPPSRAADATRRPFHCFVEARTAESKQYVLPCLKSLNHFPTTFAVNYMAKIAVYWIRCMLSSDPSSCRKRSRGPSCMPSEACSMMDGIFGQWNWAVPEIVRHSVSDLIHPLATLSNPNVTKSLQIEVQVLGWEGDFAFISISLCDDKNPICWPRGLSLYFW